MTTVADASAVLALITDEAIDELLRKRLLHRQLHAPALIDAEVLSGIRRSVQGGKTTFAQALNMLNDFANLRIIRHPARQYWRRVIELRNNLSAYDALYVALAERLRMPLLTKDARTGRAPGHEADVHVYP